MIETVWQEFIRRFPWAESLSGEALNEAIAANWNGLDTVDRDHMFKRMAMYVAEHDR